MLTDQWHGHQQTYSPNVYDLGTVNSNKIFWGLKILFKAQCNATFIHAVTNSTLQGSGSE